MYYTISEIRGKKIKAWSGNFSNHTYIVDVSSYKSGVYILNTITDRGK